MTAICNPYWDRVRGLRRVSEAVGGGIMGEPPRLLRDHFVWRYAWAIPDPGTLAWLASALGRARHDRVIEIGAGTGYLARMLTQHGLRVTAYDSRPPHRVPNRYCLPRFSGRPRHTRPVFHDVRRGGPAMARHHPGAALLLCWPPYDRPMARQALDWYQAAGGQLLVYIGEGPGDACADDAFFELLDAGWERDGSIVPARWFGIHDTVEVWRR